MEPPKRFSPEALLSAPRRSAAVSNCKGTKALYTVSTYSFSRHSKKSEIKILDIRSGESELVSDKPNCFDANWIDEDTILYFQSGEDGTTKLIIRSQDGSLYSAGTIDGPVSNLKIASVSTDRYVLAMVGKATRSGLLYNPDTAQKPHSSAMTYTNMFVRYWDEYIKPEVNQIFYCYLTRREGSWEMGSDPINALAKTGMTAPFAWFGGDGTTEDFDVCSHGILFLARDPAISPIRDTRMDCYYLSFQSKRPQVIRVPGLEGVAWSPLFSPDGKKAVFHQTKYEEMDQHKIVYVSDVVEQHAEELYLTPEGKGYWDVSCTSNLCWGNDSSTIFFSAEYRGKQRLWKVELDEEEIKLPQSVFETGSVSAACRLSQTSNKLLISSSSFTDNSVYTILDPETFEKTVLSKNLNGLSDHGISRSSQISDFWFQGAEFPIHSWMIKPSDFDSSKKYPLAYVFHGGPESSWLDVWSTRWNPLCLAERGFIVVCTNRTGSTGYGQRFTDAVRGEWGGLPFTDLELGFKCLEENFPFIDTERAVGLGGSYGGYMTAWIQGQPFGRKFKALVCHNGQLYNQSELCADDVTGAVAAWKGTYWENRALYDKYDPSRFTENWSTPMLIVHGMLDFRVPVEQGLGMFGVLQYKGVESKYLTFPDENHWVLKAENSLVWHNEVYAWIKKFTTENAAGD